MSFVGRPPTPTALKILQGNPGKRPLPIGEPKMEVKIPDCPDHLDEIGRQEWDRVTGILFRARIIAEGDYFLIGVFCSEYSMYLQALKSLKASGSLVYSPKGKPKVGPDGKILPDQARSIQPSPYHRIIARCIGNMNKIAGQIGLTQVGRIKMAGGAKPEESNPWAKF